MAFLYFDRVKETSASTGTGNIVLAGAVTGFQDFATVYADGDTMYYVIADTAGPDWEVGIGTFVAAGPEIARTTVTASSNAGALVNFTSGALDVSVDIAAAQLLSVAPSTTGTGNIVLADSAALVTPDLGVPSAVDLANGTNLPVATGISGLGTDVAAFLATPSSANLAAAITDETGTGALVFADSPALVGDPTAPTQTAGDNSTKLATTAYVDAAIPSQLISEAFTSTDQTITAGGALTIPHGMSAAPLFVQSFLVCQSANGGWSTGDAIYINPNTSYESNLGMALYADSTNIYVRYGSDNTTFGVLNKSSGVGYGASNSNWKLRIKAWA